MLLSIQKELNEEIKPTVYFYIYVTWIISFVLALKDESQCSDLIVCAHISFGFRTWLWVEGWTTLTGLLLLTVVPCCFSCCWGYDRLQPFILVILGLFKLCWMVIGVFIFLFLDFKLCEDLLLSFSIALFIGFLYILLRTLGAIIGEITIKLK